MSENNSEFNTPITKNVVMSSFIWKMLERFFAQFANLVIQIILARILMPEDFGSLAIIVAFVNFSSIFVQSGLATAVVQKEKFDESDIATLWVMSIGVAFVFFGVIYLLAPTIANAYDMPNLIWPMRVLSLVLFPNAINAIQTAILSRKMEFKKLCIRSMIAVPASGVIGISMAYMGYGLWSLVAQNLSNMVLTMLIMSFGMGLPAFRKFSMYRAKSIYAFSGKIMLSNLVSNGYDMVRTMTIGKQYTASELAHYDKAYTYTYYVVQIVNSSISSVLLSVFSRNQSDVNHLHAMARKSTKLVSFLMIPLLIGGVAVAPQLIPLLLTSKWVPAIPFFIAFCILRIPGCITTIDKQVYYAIGRSGITLVFECCLFALNLLTLFLTLKHGALSIAIGAVIVEWLGTFLIFGISAKVYRYSIWERFKDMILPTVNSLIMLVVLRALVLLNLGAFVTLLLQLAVGILVYLLLAVITKDDNLQYLIKMLRGFLSRKKRSNE